MTWVPRFMGRILLQPQNAARCPSWKNRDLLSTTSVKGLEGLLFQLLVSGVFHSV